MSFAEIRSSRNGRFVPRWRGNEEQDVREDGHSLRIGNYMQFALAANESRPWMRSDLLLLPIN